MAHALQHICACAKQHLHSTLLLDELNNTTRTLQLERAMPQATISSKELQAVAIKYLHSVAKYKFIVKTGASATTLPLFKLLRGLEPKILRWRSWCEPTTSKTYLFSVAKLKDYN